MDSTALTALIWTGAALFGVRIYWRAAGGLARSGGKVPSAPFALEDVLAAACLMIWLLYLSAHAWFGEVEKLVVENVVAGTIMMGVIAIGILLFLSVRKRPLQSTFGIGIRSIPASIRSAAGYGLASLPLVLGLGWLVRALVGTEAAPQEVVQFYIESARSGDMRAVAAVVLLGGVIAPVTEEIIFRGYIYGACKRFGGRLAGMILSAVVFGLIHANLPALPPLILLALCLTLAYEASGSLWVPIFIHAGFNLLMLGALWFAGGEVLP